MANGQKKSRSKHIGTFWPIFLIVIVSMVAGAIIYAFAYGNMQQDDNYSVMFWPHMTVLTRHSGMPHKSAGASLKK